MGKRKQPVKIPGLSIHKATKQYCKRHQGRLYYFGNDTDAALERYRNEWPDIVAGRPRRQKDSITVADLCNQFLDTKRTAVNAGELSPRTWSEYHRCCEHVAKALGRNVTVGQLAPEDFGKLRALLVEHYAANGLSKYITFARMVFAWG